MMIKTRRCLEILYEIKQKRFIIPQFEFILMILESKPRNQYEKSMKIIYFIRAVLMASLDSKNA